LQQRLERDGPLELHEILRIGMQTAAGLAAAHAQGLIHRDIKPANILLENGVERVKITDFGLARAANEASMTQTGVVAGTPHYMSPEQAEGKPLDQRTDLFSLGSVMYAMCTGRTPFRAVGSMAVLKRVCEETPTPIRETNPEIPDWLVAIIDKLHAKEPAERFQSAPEVADLLSQHLAHVQHPSVAGTLRVPSPMDRLAGQSRGQVSQGHISRSEMAPRRRWAVAAAILLVGLLSGLTFTEATGVTNLRATVIRIFTPDGVLVVETDDPAVKVTVEGDGGLLITGAGLEEIRLRPGSYRVQADRDGKPVPLDKNLVEVARGGRAIVKVKLEASPAPRSSTAEQGAFVLLAAGKERKFDTLAEAVQSASNDDTIEIRGNGPFVTDGVTMRHSLVIRAGEGYVPSITLSEASAGRNDHLLKSAAASLVLEGLELRRIGQATGSDKNQLPRLLESWHAGALHLANCRLVCDADIPPRSNRTLINTKAAALSLRNCQLSGDATYAVGWRYPSGGRCDVENCVSAVGFLGFHQDDPDASDVSIRLHKNTLVGDGLTLVLWRNPNLPDGADAAPPIRLDMSRNVTRFDPSFHNRGLLYFHQEKEIEKPYSPAEAEILLSRLVQLNERQNLYQSSTHMLQLAFGWKVLEGGTRARDLADWNRFWNQQNTGSTEGEIRFNGGELIRRVQAAPDQLTPDDFRLRQDSAGYRAGPDGKDLGADVDLVGPGEAYERWKQTPEYQQWLKDTGQLRAESPKAEPKAFVVLTGKGVEVGKFDTLAEAVQGASDGDTIEIRGNGPFVTEPIDIPSGRALIIRAAEGLRPVIQADPEEKGQVLLRTRSPLVLEGLDLQWMDAKAYDRPDGRSNYLVVAREPTSRLHVANCRFLMNRRDGIHNLMSCIGIWGAPFCHLRNCQMGIGGYGTVGAGSLIFQGSQESQCVVDNCLFNSAGVSFNLSSPAAMTAVLNRNTLLESASLQFSLHQKIDPPLATKGSRPVQVETSGNIFNGHILFTQGPTFLAKEKVLSASEAEELLTKLVDWRENRNLYFTPKDADLLSLLAVPSPGKYTVLSPTAPIKTLEDWKRFWDLEETDSQLGQAKFQGGDLHAKAVLTPHLLTPEDFRLRPDSAGYKAAKDGKDLGADVDLVGPGAAYERWKKTPEYREWLKETGQLRTEAPTPGPKAFVVLTGTGVEVRKFDTLAEAVQGASDGDTIEVRGNGPFISDGVAIGNRLVIRAGEGYAPTITLSQAAADKNIPLLKTSAALVLEGLELRRIGGAEGIVENRVARLLHPLGSGTLYVANCRLIYQADRPHLARGGLFSSGQKSVSVRNSVLSANSTGQIGWGCRSGGQFSVENCVSASAGLGFETDEGDFTDVSIRFRGNSFAGKCMTLILRSKPNLPANDETSPPIRLDFSHNVVVIGAGVRSSGVLYFHRFQLQPPFSTAEALLPRLVRLEERQNVYLRGTNMLGLGVDGTAIEGRPDHDLADWRGLWKQSDTGSVDGDVRFQGGDLVQRARTAPQDLTAEDFRLRPDSAGYRAGPDGKDLGADVDLVGPGEAYERWKQTPEYQRWLKDTGQVK
jgi:hypothetical protein